MPNKNYVRGSTKEREVVNQARSQGFLSFRSAGSHSKIDVVIAEPNKTYFLQLKRVKTKYYNFDKELQELKDLKLDKHIIKQLWIYRDYEKRNNKWQKISIP